MDRPGDREGERMLELVVSAMADIDAGRSVWQQILAEVCAALDANLGGVFDVAWPGGASRVVQAWPAWAAHVAASPAENRAYPLIRHFGRHRDALPRTLGDVADDCRWRTSPRYARMREQFTTARHHVAALIRTSPDGIRLIGFGRPGRNFDTPEQDFVRRVLQVLIPLDRHVETVARWRRAARVDPGATPVDCLSDARLTPRELTILVLLADGLDPSSIGRRLAISPRTVTKHQENVQRKLGTRDRLNTVLRAQTIGIIRPRIP